MTDKRPIVYPYVPNSAPQARQEMLREVGAESVEAFYARIPEAIRLDRRLKLPPPILSECDLRRHVTELLSRNKTCEEYLNFLGGGCWQHYVPAICDEISQRSEFLTAYAGEPYDDHGRFQALFEFASMMGELVDMDVVCVPTYDWLQAAATSVRMAARITGRCQVLVAGAVGRQRLSKIKDYCKPRIEVHALGYQRQSGGIDLEALESAVSHKTAAVYFESPNYLGLLEVDGEEIARMAHENGALCVVGVDPISLGILAPPGSYGADMVCGDLQPLGMHMQFGGGQAGFIATRDEEEFVMEYPFRLFGLTPTRVPGEYGFGDVAYERTSFAVREKGKEFVGTATALWGITAGVFLALMGPQGMAELGETILLRSQYAMQELAKLKGLSIPFAGRPHFKEFVVNFDQSGRTVQEINRRLLEHQIFGGNSLCGDFVELGESALFCVTEVHTKEDIDRLARALQEALP